MSSLSFPATAVVALADRILSEVVETCPDLGEQIGDLRRRLHEPPRILVVGGRGTGKTTLVHALTGTAPAPSADPVLYCSADRPPPRDLPLTVSIRQVEGPSLHSISLVDPASLPLPVPEQDRAAVADACLYLVDREPNDADLERIRGTGLGPAGTVLIISRADEFGAGALGSVDPVADARRYAAHLRRSTAPCARSPLTSAPWATALAVSPLLATASVTVADLDDAALTRFTERLASYDSAALGRVLIRADGGGVPPSLHRDLVRTGTYGVLHGKSALSSRGDRREELTAWLSSVSGLSELRAQLLGDTAQAALLKRTSEILGELGQLKFTTRKPGGLADVLEHAWSLTGAWRIRLYPSIAELSASGFDRDSALVMQMVDADSLYDLAEVPVGSSPADVANGVREQLRKVNIRLTGFTVPVAEAALTSVSAVLRRAVAEADSLLAGNVVEEQKRLFSTSG
ncbi:hypothetical protein [Corynebacterium neomassiliense]|uniref:hypothetical protein n=1 Tax=Corynebacterium neomassiliense TaxID=2079482 RepID=UPI00102F43AF|nr:hypothetical protein [Corynebacterium neomassiliense]